jgi:hypothetical protein
MSQPGMYNSQYVTRQAATKRRDYNIKSSDDDILNHESFLGTTSFPRTSITNKWIYSPIALDGFSMQPHDKGTLTTGTRGQLVPKRWIWRSDQGKDTKIPPNHIVSKRLSEHLGLSDQATSISG